MLIVLVSLIDFETYYVDRVQISCTFGVQSPYEFRLISAVKHLHITE